MRTYVLRRLLLFVPTLLGASLLIFVTWLGDLVRGDFGYSYSQRRPVNEILVERLPRSLELAARGAAGVDQRNYRQAPTASDNNTFMKVWLAQ